MQKKFLMTVVTMIAVIIGIIPNANAAVGDINKFDLVVSAGAAQCQPAARGQVTVTDRGRVQDMHVEVAGLRANTEFTLFVIQVPKAPFGLVWYQGDILTNAKGRGIADFKGIFSRETFIHAQGTAPAPAVFPDDATTNPSTAPIQLYHLGLWFADLNDASSVSCPATETLFDGDHLGGIQVLNTANFPDGQGPLSNLQ